MARLLCALLVLAAAGCSDSPRPNLLLVTIDTLRADHLSAYGYHRETTPNIDALAATGVLFETVIAPATETQPSCASLLTGRWPVHLGVRGNAQPLPAGVPTLASVLRDNGYLTAAFVSGYPLLRRLSRLDRGFDLYDDDLPDPRGEVPRVQRTAEKTTGAALRWLQRKDQGPFFLWVHYYDPHGDYAPGDAYVRLFDDDAEGPEIASAAIPPYQRIEGETDAAEYVRRYDGEIRRTDDQIARLLEALGTGRQLSQTVVAVTADHGESLLEHDYYFDHGNELYMASAHVPLILSGPGVPTDGRTIAGIARTPDIMPTLLELLDVSAPHGMGGMSLGDAIVAGRTSEREAASEARLARYPSLTSTSDVGPKLAVRDERFTVILRLDGRLVEAYDRLEDPGETRDLLPSTGRTQREDLLTELARAVERRFSSLGDGASLDGPALDDDLRARLAALTADRP